MDEVQVVQERYRSQQLTRKGLDVRAGEWHKAAGLQEIEDGEPE